MGRVVSNTPKDPDFDWVTARHECSLVFEFECLKQDIQRSKETREQQIPANGSTRRFVNSKDDMILIEREDRGIMPRSSVKFCLEKDCIHVRPLPLGDPLSLTLTLNDAGKCRFRINGKGEYRRWQILRRALENLLF